MTREEVLKASPERLRELVAIHVMGWKKRFSPDIEIWAWEMPSGTRVTQEAWYNKAVGNWLEDLNHTWQVVAAITEIPRTIEQATRAANTRFGDWWDDAYLWAHSASEAADAICRAALLAVTGGQ